MLSSLPVSAPPALPPASPSAPPALPPLTGKGKAKCGGGSVPRSQEPVIRLGPRLTQSASTPRGGAGRSATAPATPGHVHTTTAPSDTDDAAVVVLPHHGHPHCSTTESGSPLVAGSATAHYYWLAAHAHTHRPIVLHDLVSSLTPPPQPPQPPSPTPLGHRRVNAAPVPAPAAVPIGPHAPPRLVHVPPVRPTPPGPMGHAITAGAHPMFRPPAQPAPPSGVAAATTTANRPPRGIFAPKPAPLPGASSSSSPAAATARSANGKPPCPRPAAHSPSPLPAAIPKAITSGVATPSTSSHVVLGLPLPPRDASGRWRRKDDSLPADPAYARPPPQRAPMHTHPARQHFYAPLAASCAPTKIAHAMTAQVGSPPLTPTPMLDAPPPPTRNHPAVSQRPPTSSPPPPAASTGLVQLPPATTTAAQTHFRRPRTTSASSLSDAAPAAADRYAMRCAGTLHPTPSSSDELTDPATSDADDRASHGRDQDGDEDDDEDVSSDTCALCHRHSVPPPSKLPAIVAQSPFPSPPLPSAALTTPTAAVKSVTHWAGCDYCPRWYHCACLGVPNKVVSKLAKLACPLCATVHGHATKVKDKEAKRVAEQVGEWVKKVFAARMARRPPPPQGLAKPKQRKRQRSRGRTPPAAATGRNAQSILCEPVVAYAVRGPASAMVYMDRATAGTAALEEEEEEDAQVQGDVIALPPLSRRGRSRITQVGHSGLPDRRAHAREAHGGYSSAESAGGAEMESGSGSDADTDGECDDDANGDGQRAEEAMHVDEDGEDEAELSECDSTYAASVCSALFAASAAHEPTPAYHDHPPLFQHYPSGLARRCSLSPSEATEVEYSRPASPEPHTDGGHEFADYDHSGVPYVSSVSPLDTLLAAANVVAVTDAADAAPSANPLASLASVASMMLLDDAGHGALALPAHQEQLPVAHVNEAANKLLILADSAWASSLALGSPVPASPPATDAAHAIASASHGPHLPPTPVSASESDAGQGGAEMVRHSLKRPRDDNDNDADVFFAACAKNECVQVDAKRLKVCDVVPHVEAVEMTAMSSTSL